MKKTSVTTVLPLLNANSVVYATKRDVGRPLGKKAPFQAGRNAWALINGRKHSYFCNGSLWIPVSRNSRPDISTITTACLPEALS